MFTAFPNPSTPSGSPKNGEKKFVGSAACKTCHSTIYASHIKTAHYLDSRLASKEAIKGSFAPGKNKFLYNKWMEVVMEQKDGGFFQTALVNGMESQSGKFDIVIGSGRKGQTYLSWQDDVLYQLPVSYYSPLNSWCNSPGYPSNYIKFDRIIPAQCLECHGTYAKYGIDSTGITFFDTNQVMYGIDCERCHGPAADHVIFHQEHPAEKQANYITSYKLLNRQQRLDACALCHSGFRDEIQPAFTFQAGDKLDEFSAVKYNPDSVSTLDVHGNQYGLLTSSKCFRMSEQMDCASCHNVHQDEANRPDLFSQRCISCHAATKHTSFTLPSKSSFMINKNCVDCHMPMLPSQKIVLNVAGTEKSVPDLVRTHRVAIYPDITKAFLGNISAKNK